MYVRPRFSCLTKSRRIGQFLSFVEECLIISEAIKDLPLGLLFSSSPTTNQPTKSRQIHIVASSILLRRSPLFARNPIQSPDSDSSPLSPTFKLCFSLVESSPAIWGIRRILEF
ncbi:hypothetical protein Bca4012_020684 [Brassica carinata]